MTTKTKPDVNKKAVISLRTVAVRSASHRKQRDVARKARDELDKSMLAARLSGATYRDIATAAEVSTAWVQASLERAGYKTAPR